MKSELKKIFFYMLFLSVKITINAQISTSTGGGTNVIPNEPNTNTNVGIGTTNPTAKLEVFGGDLKISNNMLLIGKPFNTWHEGVRDWSIKADRGIAIRGTVDNVPTCLQIDNESIIGALQLAFAGGDYFFSNQSKKGDAILRGNIEGSLIITNEGRRYSTGARDIKFVTQDMEESSQVRMIIDKTGNIGIGTSNFTDGSDTYRLSVKGKVRAEEIKVYNTWADYVFKSGYKLPSLNDVESYIKENGHLPKVPSAKEVTEKGLELGEMTKIQQEKIEELTLYIIEQNKVNKKQEEKIQVLEKQAQEIEVLKELVKKITERK